MLKGAVLAIAMMQTAAVAADRSAAARAEFQRTTPCPATGKSRGPCPGYVVDHVKPLCAGGADHRANMQWQTADAGKAKDRAERRMCAQQRR